MDHRSRQALMAIAVFAVIAAIGLGLRKWRYRKAAADGFDPHFGIQDPGCLENCLKYPESYGVAVGENRVQACNAKCAAL